MAGCYTHNGKIIMNIKNCVNPQCYADPYSTEYGGGGFAMKDMYGTTIYPFSLSYMAAQDQTGDSWDKACATLFDSAVGCIAPWRTIRGVINNTTDQLSRNLSGVCFSSNTDAPSEMTYVPHDIVTKINYQMRFVDEYGGLNYVFSNGNANEVTINKAYFVFGTQYMLKSLDEAKPNNYSHAVVFYEELLETPLVVPAGASFAICLKPHLVY